MTTGGVAQRGLGDHRDAFHAVPDLGDDVGRGTDAGVVGAGAHGRGDGALQALVGIDYLVAGLHHQLAVAHQLAVLVGVALARAGVAQGDAALHGAVGADGIALAQVGGLGDGSKLTHAGAHAALAALLVDDGFALHHMDRVQGAVLLAEHTALTGFQIHIDHECAS